MCQGRVNLQKEINRLAIRCFNTENSIFFFYLRQGRVNLQKEINRLAIRYFDTVGFLSTKTYNPDYSSVRATLPLWPWFQGDIRVSLLNLRFNNFLRLGNILARNLAEARTTSLVSFATTGIADKNTPS